MKDFPERIVPSGRFPAAGAGSGVLPDSVKSKLTLANHFFEGKLNSASGEIRKPPEDKRMASRLIRNQLPFTGLRVRVPCPPLHTRERRTCEQGAREQGAREQGVREQGILE